MEVTLIYNILSLKTGARHCAKCFTVLDSLASHNNHTGRYCDHSSLQMETLRCREAKKLSQGHTASNPAELGFKLGSVCPRGKNLNHWPILPPRSDLTCLLK